MATRDHFRSLRCSSRHRRSIDFRAAGCPTRERDHTLKPTAAVPSIERPSRLWLQEVGRKVITCFISNTRAFAQRGILDIDIQIAANSATDGSFDLFSADTPIFTKGRPDGTLTGPYDIRRGTSTRLEHRFQSGQVFALGLEGNWGSPQGAMGIVKFRASVAEHEVPAASSNPGDRIIKLTPASFTADRETTIVAPGNGQRDYNAFFIDAKDFVQGAILHIDM